jgi:hypothetical protein
MQTNRVRYAVPTYRTYSTVRTVTEYSDVDICVGRMGEGGGAADGSDKVEPQLRRHVRQARRQLPQDEETTRLSQGLHQVPGTY